MWRGKQTRWVHKMNEERGHAVWKSSPMASTHTLSSTLCSMALLIFFTVTAKCVCCISIALSHTVSLHFCKVLGLPDISIEWCDTRKHVDSKTESMFFLRQFLLRYWRFFATLVVMKAQLVSSNSFTDKQVFNHLKKKKKPLHFFLSGPM